MKLGRSQKKGRVVRPLPLMERWNSLIVENNVDNLVTGAILDYFNF